MLELYIRTRGHRIDYSFLLVEKEPPIPKSYKSDIEQPTCILERTEDNTATLFLSSIPSNRKDHQGTPIRYDVVAKINSQVGDNDPDEKKHLMGLTGLISMWLTGVKSTLQEIEEEGKTIDLVRLPLQSDLGEELDKIFPPLYLEELLELTNSRKSTEAEEQKKTLDKKLEDLLSKMPRVTEEDQQSNHNKEWEGGIFSDNNWWGGINDDSSRKEWIKLVKKLLQGETKGKALLLNIATPQSLSTLSMENGELGVLLAKEWSRHKPEEIKKIETPVPEESNTMRNTLGSVSKLIHKGKTREREAKKKIGEFLNSHWLRGKDTD